MIENLVSAENPISSLYTTDLNPLFWRPARVGVMSAWWGHVPFAQWIVAKTRPRMLVELGTHNGVSYSAFCEAVMREGLSTQCSAVDTWEGDEQAGYYGEGVFSELKAFHDTRYSSFSNLVRSTFNDALAHFVDGTIDLLHIDGLHSYQAVRDDFIAWLPKMSDKGVILFHDTCVRQNDFGVFKLWNELQLEYPSFSFVHAHGLGVLAVGNDVPLAIQKLCSVNDEIVTNAIRERFSFIGERWELQYRDHVRSAEIVARDEKLARLTDEIAQRVKQTEHLEQHAIELAQAVETVKKSHLEQGSRLHECLESLRLTQEHAGQLELARHTLHEALQAQIARADTLSKAGESAQLSILAMETRISDFQENQRLAAEHTDQLEQARATLHEALQEQIARADTLSKIAESAQSSVLAMEIQLSDFQESRRLAAEHAEQLEQARSTLHNALHEQQQRADALSTKADALSTLGATLSEENDALNNILNQVRKQLEISEYELDVQKKKYGDLINKITLLRIRSIPRAIYMKFFG